MPTQRSGATACAWAAFGRRLLGEFAHDLLLFGPEVGGGRFVDLAQRPVVGSALRLKVLLLVSLSRSQLALDCLGAKLLHHLLGRREIVGVYAAKTCWL